jgi:hypothetical protein
MATKKEELSRWRNLTKRNLMKRQEAVNNLLSSLPSGVKSLSDDERVKLLQIRSLYNDILSTWNYRSSELVSQVNVNL